MRHIGRDYLKMGKVILKFLILTNFFFDEADDTVDKYREYIQLNWKSEAKNNKFIYQRGNQLSQRQEQRKKLHKSNLIKHAQQY